MSFIASIGLEIHLAIKTPIKAFSPESIDSISWVSLGFPGTLPTLNLDAVKKVIRIAASLNCEVNYQNIVFDRKNYFYYDLPKGYQITQYFSPIGKKGHMFLSNGTRIEIKQIHMEEDSAQQIKSGHDIKLSFSRLGRALIEVVTEPSFSSYSEIEEFLKKLRRYCKFLGVSDASYENGEIRVDLNVSVRKKKEDPLSSKSEIKNLNSLLVMKKSLEWLLEEQKKQLEDGKELESYTYCWAEKLQKCEIMRKKRGVSEYFYIPEANIPKLVFSKEEYEELVKDVNIDFEKLKSDLEIAGLRDVEIEHLLNNYDLYEYVMKLNKKIDNLKSSHNWIVNVVSGFVENWNNFSFEEVEKVILDVEINKKINMNLSKSLFKEMFKNNVSYKAALKKLKISSVIFGDAQIKKLVKEAFEKYKDQLPKLMSNPMKLEKLIIGECMQKTKGQADPLKTKEYFEELLDLYKEI